MYPDRTESITFQINKYSNSAVQFVNGLRELVNIWNCQQFGAGILARSKGLSESAQTAFSPHASITAASFKHVSVSLSPAISSYHCVNIKDNCRFVFPYRWLISRLTLSLALFKDHINRSWMVIHNTTKSALPTFQFITKTYPVSTLKIKIGIFT